MNVNTSEMAAKMQEHTDLYTWGSDLWGQLGVADGVDTLSELRTPLNISRCVRVWLTIGVPLMCRNRGGDATEARARAGAQRR